MSTPGFRGGVGGGAQVLPLMGYIGMRMYRFIVRNRVSLLILAILVSNRRWFLHSSLQFGMAFFEEDSFSSLWI